MRGSPRAIQVPPPVLSRLARPHPCVARRSAAAALAAGSDEAFKQPGPYGVLLQQLRMELDAEDKAVCAAFQCFDHPVVRAGADDKGRSDLPHRLAVQAVDSDGTG